MSEASEFGRFVGAIAQHGLGFLHAEGDGLGNRFDEDVAATFEETRVYQTSDRPILVELKVTSLAPLRNSWYLAEWDRTSPVTGETEAVPGWTEDRILAKFKEDVSASGEYNAWGSEQDVALALRRWLEDHYAKQDEGENVGITRDGARYPVEQFDVEKWKSDQGGDWTLKPKNPELGFTIRDFRTGPVGYTEAEIEPPPPTPNAGFSSLIPPDWENTFELGHPNQDARARLVTILRPLFSDLPSEFSEITLRRLASYVLGTEGAS